MKAIAVLGSTGSIGQSTLRVARHLKGKIAVKALAAFGNIDLLEEQIREFHPEIVAVFDEKKAADLRRRVSIPVVSGEAGMCAVAAMARVEFVVVAIVGLAALAPTLAAIDSGKGIGLANKEVLVSAGELVMKRAEKRGVTVIPIDSEHSALFQCLRGEKRSQVRRLILTASGGPFRSFSSQELASVTVSHALKHPTWQMGPKITVDSSTLMNKALEVIEAHFLFSIPAAQIEVVVHPESIIHSFVECIDGSILAQMSEPAMILPIQYALTYPERVEGILPPFDFTKHPKFEFYSPDLDRFPSLRFAYEALKAGGSLPCYLNAANEVLVERFLQEKISWLGIAERLEKLLGKHRVAPVDSLASIFAVDQEAREEAREV